MNKHSSICPASETLTADDCVCVYIETERERIIALLESIRQGDEWIGREYAIALIKGDNK